MRIVAPKRCCCCYCHYCRCCCCCFSGTLSVSTLDQQFAIGSSSNNSSVVLCAVYTAAAAAAAALCLFSACNLFSSFGSVCLIPYFPLLLHLPSFLSSPLRLCRLLHFPPHFLLLHSISLHSTTFAALALAFLFITRSNFLYFYFCFIPPF